MSAAKKSLSLAYSSIDDEPPETGYDGNRKYGNGSGGGGMDGRVARLEADVEHIKFDIAEIKSNTGTLAENVSGIRSDVSVIASNYVTKETLLLTQKDISDVINASGKEMRDYIDKKFTEQKSGRWTRWGLIIGAIALVPPFVDEVIKVIHHFAK